MMSCLNGYFIDPQTESLSGFDEGGCGGAVAVWASTALTFPDSQSEMSKDYYQLLFSNPNVRIGDAVKKAKLKPNDADVRRTCRSLTRR